MSDQTDPDEGILPDAEMETTDDAPDFDPATETLSGDLRDWLLGRIRTLQKPWQQMTESEQIDLANAADLGARDVIRRFVRTVTKHTFPHAVVTLGEVKIKGEKGIEAKIGCANIEHNRTVLGEHVGQMIQVLMINSEVFLGERAPVDIDKDQPELPVGDDEDDQEAEAA